MISILNGINRFVWGVPALILILAAGLWLSIRTGWAQFRLFPRAIRAFFAPSQNISESDGVSPFKALCTALAATERATLQV